MQHHFRAIQLNRRSFKAIITMANAPIPSKHGNNSSCVPAQPPRQYRYWSQTGFGQHYRHNTRKNHRFIIASYNILAQSLLEKHSYLYGAHIEEHLSWSHRFKCIIHEILSLRPSILTLQEVQDIHLNEIATALAPLQYAKPLYKQRTANDQDDGCAIFYDPKQFRLVEYQLVEYYQPDTLVSRLITQLMVIVHANEICSVFIFSKGFKSYKCRNYCKICFELS